MGTRRLPPKMSPDKDFDRIRELLNQSGRSARPEPKMLLHPPMPAVQPKAPMSPYHPKPPEGFPAKLSVHLEPVERDTDLAEICGGGHVRLPTLVKIGETFPVEGSEMKLVKNEELMLHFLSELPRVQAVDASGNVMWLPVNSEQTYERLPLDPRLDDKMFTGVENLLNSVPLPSVLRVLEGFGSGNETEHLDQEDLVFISHIEEVEMKDTKEKVVVGKNQLDQLLRLHGDMDCATFTTMLSALLLHMSDLLEFGFPQRVRVVGSLSLELRRPKTENVLKLLKQTDVIHVIATRHNSPQLLSIPITLPLMATVMKSGGKIPEFLPPLYPTINLTWGYTEFGRAELPRSMSETTQPLPEVLKAWQESYTGKEYCSEVAGTNIKDFKDDIVQLKNYNKDLQNMLSACSKPRIPERIVVPPSGPPFVKEPGSGPMSPPVPARIRTGLPAPQARTEAADCLPREPKPLPKPGPSNPGPPKPGPRNTPRLWEPKSKDQPTTTYLVPDTKFSPRKLRTDDDGDDNGDDNDDNDDACYEDIPDIASPVDKTAKKETPCYEQMFKELREILKQKEIMMVKLKEENEHLKQISENQENEKEHLKTSNNRHVNEIHRLQCEVDRMLSAKDAGLYDTLAMSERPLPELPVGVGAKVYSTPDGLAVDRACLPTADSEGVADILRKNDLVAYVDRFQEERVDGALLMELDETVLKEDLGMTGLHAKKLLMEVNKHKK